eukprot:scaffold59241_cov57-Phaeocystis_antarctica.AAC.2
MLDTLGACVVVVLGSLVSRRPPRGVASSGTRESNRSLSAPRPPSCVGRLRRVPGCPERENRISEAAIEPPAGGFDACGARAPPGGLSGAVEHAGGASRVSFADPGRRLFRAPHGALCAKVRGALRPDRGHGGHVRSSPTQRACDGDPGRRRPPGGRVAASNPR